MKRPYWSGKVQDVAEIWNNWPHRAFVEEDDANICGYINEAF
jgi:hypothetical protein